VSDETQNAGRDAPTVVQPAEGQPPAAINARAAAIIEVVACSGLPTQLAMAGLLALAGIAPYDEQGQLSAAYVFVLPLADAVLLIALVTWFLRLHGERFTDVLFGRRPVLPELVRGVLHVPLLFLLAVAVMLAVRMLVPALHDVPLNPLGTLVESPQQAVIFAAVAVVGGGIREEIQRAFILHRFRQHLGGAAIGLVLFSVVFGLGHSLQGTDIAVTTAALGLFWGVVYLRTGSIVAPVVSHSGFNTAEILRAAVLGN
jgi:membrane protease YdiL (CAAX protease family)